ncbi:glucosamine-6-phosphate deaminase [Aquibacillus rhizosphaerae]|uniref:Glucosamine-6-phosphate deaminase n=1 Tax=Aquibacillus rhizosphaerae TaxID=3051431 RepID=A0ABT7L9Q3_9BACI|nr:glucosamine-6-phosphate deaminase [Aquibacillus sp. LR5S19]MDL4842104.1 glucosamine-6-phosphate deaminase [Aquibacillus sp. LR5S19]
MQIIRVEDYEDISKKATEILLDRIRTAEKLVLGLATGSTPVLTYQYLVKDHQENQTSYQHVTSFNLDEYIGLPVEDPNSYHTFMDHHLFNHIDIPREQIFLPNGLADNQQQACIDYEKQIQNHGGIDLQLLGIGSNGHIGFNEPGTPFDSATHIVDLAESTRKANARFFDSIEEVPKQAITMGIGSILRSKEILLLVSGEKKSKALARLLEKQVDSQFPASALHHHAHVTIVADKAALQYTNEKSSVTQ